MTTPVDNPSRAALGSGKSPGARLSCVNGKLAPGSAGDTLGLDAVGFDLIAAATSRNIAQNDPVARTSRAGQSTRRN
jgi:hypothetical protein